MLTLLRLPFNRSRGLRWRSIHTPLSPQRFSDPDPIKHAAVLGPIKAKPFG
jgi:hypothetical protein